MQISGYWGVEQSKSENRTRGIIQRVKTLLRSLLTTCRIMGTMKNFIFAFFCLAFLLSSSASARPKFRIFDFEIGGVRFLEDRGKTSAFIDGAWTPLWDAEDYGFHGVLQFSSYKTNPYYRTNPTGPEERFLVTTAGGSAFVRFYSLMNLEVTAGMQTWHHSAFGTNPLVGVALLMRVGEDLFDRIYLGYQRLLSSTDKTGILRVGFAFNL